MAEDGGCGNGESRNWIRAGSANLALRAGRGWSVKAFFFGDSSSRWRLASSFVGEVAVFSGDRHTLNSSTRVANYVDENGGKCTKRMGAAESYGAVVLTPTHYDD
ncbi:uncharacterized protein LOC143185965 [Calliopsis andreniformis]|uniref:uncharacterized protein LOC143185965 n=1 Tax=Calliopsis andreniformis TaxID=337506 RepID=UPI003FCE5CE9